MCKFWYHLALASSTHWVKEVGALTIMSAPVANNMNSFLYALQKFMKKEDLWVHIFVWFFPIAWELKIYINIFMCKATKCKKKVFHQWMWEGFTLLLLHNELQHARITATPCSQQAPGCKIDARVEFGNGHRSLGVVWV